ncbi:MAG: DUF4185 domain-containing protein [Clostridia bacterium]|nr:DUF4185 domain-containing protein [Clostridia bacterium]
MHYRTLLILVIILVAIFLPCGLADEFSGDQLAAGWRTVCPLPESKQTIVNGVVSLINAQGASQDRQDLGCKLLRPALDGDWVIETHILDLKCQDASNAYGLLLYNDSDNYITLARTQQGVTAYGMLDGSFQQLFEAEDADFLRIKKNTRLQPHATYAFYTSFTSTGSWNHVGNYVDETGLFNGAEYGLLGAGQAAGYAIFDFFTDAVLESVYDDFNVPSLDLGLWRQTKNGTLATGGTLNGTFTTPTKGNPGFLMRDPMHDEYIIDTRLSFRSTSNTSCAGLSIEKGNDYLFFGAQGPGEIKATAYVDGEEETLFLLEHSGNWLRIRRFPDHYLFECSYDGIEWVHCGTYDDPQRSFSDASYGLAYQSKIPLMKVQYDFFRERPLPQGIIQGVESIHEIGQLLGSSGSKLINETMSTYNVNGADIGNMVDAGDKVYMMFGDTFSGYKTGSWRANTLAVITDTDPSDGLTFDYYITNPRGHAKEVITSRHVDYEDMTSIPTNGVYLNGRLYYHYFNVFHWGAASHWDCNYSSWAYSDDGGNTFVKAKPFWDKDTNFIHVSIVEEGDYLYIFGIPSGRFGSVKLLRVQKESILVQDAYEYYAGKAADGREIWIDNEYDAISLTPAYTGELSVVYNPAIRRYVMIYLNENTFDIELREAEALTGPWSAPVTLVDHNIDHYCLWVNCPYMLPRYVMEDGSFYFTLSKGTPYCVFWEYVKLELAP